MLEVRARRWLCLLTCLSTVTVSESLVGCARSGFGDNSVPITDCGDPCRVPCPGTDSDGDSVLDDCDICRGSNDGLDDDGDGVPDGCDACAGSDDTIDDDSDGAPNGCDICAGSDDSVDGDTDGVPDGCDACDGFDDRVDGDTDGVPDGCDVCDGFDDSFDNDGDSVPNGCDTCAGSDDNVDDDGDGVPNGCDTCAGFTDTDLDGNGTADGCDGLILWLEAGSLGTAATSVATWDDSSGHGNFAAQATAALQPQRTAGAIGGRPAVHFDAARHLTLEDRYLFAGASDGGLTLVMVAQSLDQSAGVSEVFVFDFGMYADSGYGLGFNGAAVRFYTSSGSGGTGASRNVTPATSAPVVLTARVTFGDTEHVFVNDDQLYDGAIPGLTELTAAEIEEASTRSADAGPVTIGHQSKLSLETGRHFVGYIAEVAFYRRSLSDPELTAIRCQFAAKYAITIASCP